MKVLVTGGTGHVGGHVVKALQSRGADVRVLARKQPEAAFQESVEVAIGDIARSGVGQESDGRCRQALPAECCDSR